MIKCLRIKTVNFIFLISSVASKLEEPLKMFMNLFIIGIIVSYGTASKAGSVYHEIAKIPRDESLNNYIDLVIINAQILIVESGYDPLTLPNETLSFSQEILGVTWHGEASLYNGWLRGLANIFRSSDANFLYDGVNGSVIGLETGMGIRALQGHYDGLIKFMDIGPDFQATMNVGESTSHFQAALDKNQCIFQLTTFVVDSIGLITVDISGMGILNPIIEYIALWIANFMKFFLKGFIENQIRDIVNQALSLVDISMLGPIIGCTPPPFDNALGTPNAVLYKIKEAI